MQCDWLARRNETSVLKYKDMTKPNCTALQNNFPLTFLRRIFFFQIVAHLHLKCE